MPYAVFDLVELSGSKAGKKVNQNAYPQGERQEYFEKFLQDYFSLFVFSSGKIIVGWNVLASSASIHA